MDDGRWITINGQHIFVEKGEKPINAYIKHMAKKKKGIKIEKGNERTQEIEKKENEIKPNKFGIDDPYILFGEKHDSGTVTREDIVKFYEKKTRKTGEDKWAMNAEKLADEYIKYREELSKKRRH